MKLSKYLFLALLGLMISSVQAVPITLQFDNNDGSCTGTSFPTAGGSCSDKIGASLIYDLSSLVAGGTLTVTASTGTVRQDIAPPNAGLGADGGVSGDNTGIGEYLDLVFNFDVLVSDLLFNGGTGNGHGDGWDDSLNEVKISLLTAAMALIGDVTVDLAGVGQDSTAGTLVAGDILRITALADSDGSPNPTSHYLEGMTVDTTTITTTNFVPEAGSVWLLSLGVLVLGARRLAKNCQP